MKKLPKHDMYMYINIQNEFYPRIELYNTEYVWTYNYVREMNITLMQLDEKVQKSLLSQFDKNDFVIVKFENDSSLYTTQIVHNDTDLDEALYIEAKQMETIIEKYKSEMFRGSGETHVGCGGLVFFKNENDLAIVNLSRCFGVYSKSEE